MGAGPKIRCKICNTIIQSRYEWDFVYCGCKEVAIDGGDVCCRIVGNENDWEDVPDG